VDLLVLAHALPAIMVLAVHTVKPAQKVTLVMLPGVSLIVKHLIFILMMAHLKIQEDFTA
jgi:hypothetical protein